MFCMKCGQQLPDNALFCSRCREETINAKNAQDNNVNPTESAPYVIPSASPVIESPHLYINRPTEEYREKIADSMLETRQTLAEQLEDAKQSKSSRVIVCSVIAGVSALIMLISFSAIFSGSELTMGLLTTAGISFAVTVGVVLGIAKICHYWNQVIERHKRELEQFDAAMKYNKEV